MQTHPFRNLLIAGLFLACGATAPVYEMAWSAHLTRTMGATATAHLIVLTVYLAGLGLGSRVFGAVARRSKRPLQLCGVLQVLAGLHALVFPFLHAQAHAWFLHGATELSPQTGTLLLAKVVCAAVLLLVPTMLIGGTLPLVASWLQHETVDAGRRTARYYSITCLGAAFGAGWVGLQAAPALGWGRMLEGAAALQALAGVVAILLGRESALHIMSPEPTGRGWGGRLCAGVQVWLAGGLVAGLAVLVLRWFTLLLGASQQVLVLTVASLVLGLTVGGAIAASPRLQMQGRWRLVCGALTASALWVGLSVFRMEWWGGVLEWSLTGLARSETGHLFFQGLTAAIVGVVLGLPVALTGLVFPLFMRIGEGGGMTLGDRVGRLLAWKAAGGMAGALATGCWLMPRYGLRASLWMLAGGMALLAIWIAWQRREAWMAGIAGTVMAAGVMLFATGDVGGPSGMSAGMERRPDPGRAILETSHEPMRVVFREDALEGTVSVERTGVDGAEDSFWRLRLDGRSVASAREDLGAQLLLGHLPLLMRPESTNVFMAGWGSGVAASAVLKHPVGNLIVAESSGALLRAAAHCSELDQGGPEAERVRRVGEEARLAWMLDPATYDVIIVQTVDPWVRNAGRAFTREFYELAASRLKPEGMLSQRLRVRDLNDSLLSMALRTFAEVFPHMELWDAGAGEVILLGSRSPWRSEPEVYEGGWAGEAVRADLDRLGIGSARVLWARQLASQRTAFAIAEEGPPQRDLFPSVEMAGPRACYLGTGARGLARFDERTWQWALADPAKRTVLAGLEKAEWESVFHAVPSVNPELDRVLKGNAGPGVPGVFESEPGAVPESLVRDSSPGTQRLREALALMWALDASAEQGVAVVVEQLRVRSQEAAWPAVYCAARAAQVCLALGQLDRAEALLEQGLKLAPDDAELRYLARVLKRERSRPVKVTQRR